MIVTEFYMMYSAPAQDTFRHSYRV